MSIALRKRGIKMKMHICKYCYEEMKSVGERVKIVDRYSVDITEEQECDVCKEVDDLMEVEV